MLKLASSRARLGGKRQGLRLFKAPVAPIAPVLRPSNAYRDVVLTDSPWALWLQDETQGGIFEDSSGSARSLTITGSLTAYAVQGPGLLKAASYPASTTVYGQTTAVLPGTFNGGFSLEVWVYLTATPSGVLTLIGNGTTPTGTVQKEIALSVDSSGRPLFYIFNTAGRTLTSPSALSLNAWHHIVATASTTTGMSLRVDKVTVGTLAQNSLAGYSRSVYVHAGYNATAQAALIAAPAVYLTPLSDARIDAHHTAGIAG